jgi:hypothetical protein
VDKEQIKVILDVLLTTHRYFFIDSDVVVFYKNEEAKEEMIKNHECNRSIL